LIGNTLPIAKKGDMSITKSTLEIREKALIDRVNQLKDIDIRKPERKEKLKRFRKKYLEKAQFSADAPIAQTVFGTVCVMFACLVVYVVTPRNEKYLLGLRRAKNLKKKWIPFHWDESPGLLTTVCVMVILVVTLFYFSTTLYNAPTMPTKIRELIPFIPIVCLFASVVVLVFYLVFEAWENKGLFLLILCIWVLPIMVAMVVAVQSNHYPTLVWVSSVSPIAAYGYGMLEAISLPVREAFYFSFGLQVIIGGFAGMALVRKKWQGRKVLLENPVD
jgi:uncharacterized MnhB-related membrane protein